MKVRECYMGLPLTGLSVSGYTMSAVFFAYPDTYLPSRFLHHTNNISAIRISGRYITNTSPQDER